MEREQLTDQEKLQVLESSIDRMKINKKSNFNMFLCEVYNFGDWECDCPVVSAELYTRAEAYEMISDFCIGFNKNPPMEIKLDLAHYHMELWESWWNLDESKRRLQNGEIPEKLTNFYKLVWTI
jgi:hypothetical protein